jgi:polyphosphate kinase
LIDPAVIEELYLASQAGVQIDLIVRGMCSLRPGLPEVSERIRVLSVVDRYLEHARIFYFHNSGEPLYFLASADWMPRNFDRRIEIGFPIIEAALQNRLKEVLEIQLADNVKGWWMQSDGRYIKIKIADQPLIRSQERLYESFAASANEPLSQVPSQPKS